MRGCDLNDESVDTSVEVNLILGNHITNIGNAFLDIGSEMSMASRDSKCSNLQVVLISHMVRRPA